MLTLQLPNITSSTPEGQLQELKTYLYQLTEQLNFESQDIERRLKTLEEK